MNESIILKSILLFPFFAWTILARLKFINQKAILNLCSHVHDFDFIDNRFLSPIRSVDSKCKLN